MLTKRKNETLPNILQDENLRPDPIASIFQAISFTYCKSLLTARGFARFIMHRAFVGHPRETPDCFGWDGVKSLQQDLSSKVLEGRMHQNSGNWCAHQRTGSVTAVITISNGGYTHY